NVIAGNLSITGQLEGPPLPPDPHFIELNPPTRIQHGTLINFKLDVDDGTIDSQTTQTRFNQTTGQPLTEFPRYLDLNNSGHILREAGGVGQAVFSIVGGPGFGGNPSSVLNLNDLDQVTGLSGGANVLFGAGGAATLDSLIPPSFANPGGLGWASGPARLRGKFAIVVGADGQTYLLAM
ncbi:MAG: hypothetical protein AB1758_18360, partial [Candidatus Eremiobacterota bacterium]